MLRYRVCTEHCSGVLKHVFMFSVLFGPRFCSELNMAKNVQKYPFSPDHQMFCSEFCSIWLRPHLFCSEFCSDFSKNDLRCKFSQRKKYVVIGFFVPA